MNFSLGTSPRLVDARWRLLVKWLIQVQSVGGIAANDPNITDTRWILLKKIHAAILGVAWTSPVETVEEQPMEN